jgi:hypothetical protein
MNKLKLMATVFAGFCALNAMDDGGAEVSAAVRASGYSAQVCSGVADMLAESGIDNFVNCCTKETFLEVFAERSSADHAVYAKAVANDELIARISKREVLGRREYVKKYVASGMTAFTVAESAPYLTPTLQGLHGITNLQELTFTTYVTPSDMPELIAATGSMSMLNTLKLIDIREFGQVTKDDVVAAIIEARLGGQFTGLTHLVLSHFAFKNEELLAISAELPGIEVRLSTLDDFNA